MASFCDPEARRLIQLPDPAEQHDDLEGWVCKEMCKRFGGEWSVHSSVWTPGIPFGNTPSPCYSWRPSPPEPVERRREALIADLEPVDGETSWLEHPNSCARYRFESGVLVYLEGDEWKPEDFAWIAVNHAKPWTLVELVPAEEGE